MMQVQLSEKKALGRMCHIFFFYRRVIICDFSTFLQVLFSKSAPVSSLPHLESTLPKYAPVLLLRRICFELRL